MAAEAFYHTPVDTPSPYDHHRPWSSSSVVSSPASDHSHTSFPLLQNYHDDWTPSSPAYFDDTLAPSHSTYVQPINAAGWNTALSFNSQLEKRRSWQTEEKMHKRSKILKRVALTFELVLAIWTTYTAVRYFLAYTQFESSTGQIISLVLGAVSTLALPLIASSVLLRFFEPALLAEEIPMPLIMNSAVVLLCLISFCIMAPAIVSFVFVFLWRTGVHSQLDVSKKCHLDIDVVWSTSSCDSSSPWGVWLGLGVLRLILTAGLLFTYYIFGHSYRKLRRSAWRASRSATQGYHYKRARSHVSEQTAVAQSPPRAPRPLVSAPTSPRRSFRHQPTPSNSTIATKITSRSVGTSSGAHTSEESAQTLIENMQQQQQQQQQHPLIPEVEVVSFAERFRALVSQVDDAVQYARSASPEAVDDVADDREDIYTALPQRSFQSFQTAPYQYPVVGYDEYGLPYPPDEHIPMLNGFVRRMPTIESMGSREHATTSVASSLYAYETRFGSNNSRPATRLTMRSALSETSEQPSISRGNSLQLQLAAMNTNELGEMTGSSSNGTEGSRPSEATSFYTAGDSPTTDVSSTRSLP